MLPPAPDTRFLRNDLKKDQPNCGVVAVAVAAGVSVDEAMAYFRCLLKKNGRWKGGTKHKDRIRALEHFGVKHRSYELRDKRRLETWIRDRAELGALYMLRVTGHVVLLRDGWVLDQGGLFRIETHRSRKQLLTHVVEVMA